MENPSLRRRIAVLTIVLAATPLGFSTEADTDPEATDAASPGPAAGRKAGYPTRDFRIRPSVSITERYDSNIFATHTDTVSDWITLVSPQLKVDSTWAEHSLNFKAGADFGRYWEYDAENFLDYWASLEGRIDLGGQTDLFGGLGIAYEHEGRESPDASLGGLEPTTYRVFNAHSGVKTVFGDTTYRFGATYEQLAFDNVQTGTGLLLNDDRDRELIGFGIRATHRLNEGNEVFAQALYDTRDYDLATDQSGYDRDSAGYRVAAGLKSDFGDGNKAEVYAGILSQDYEDDRFGTVNKADFGGRLTLRPAQDSKLTAKLQRSLNETTLTGSPGYLSTVLSGRLEHRVSARLIPHVSLAYEFADYLQSAREDEAYSAEAGLKYYLTRNTYLATGLRHAVRDSNDANLTSGSYDYDKTTAFLSLAVQGYPLLEPMVSDFTSDGELALGMLFLTEDAVRFGRYDGLTEQGPQWNADVRMHSSDGKQNHATISGLDLGLDSRFFNIEWGSQGEYEAFVSYDQIPFRDSVGRTVFDGVGGTRLSRPAGWVDGDSTADMTQLPSSLSQVEIGTMRKTLGAGTLLHTGNHRWTLSAGYETETKDGLSMTAGTIGSAAGNARAAMLPTPIDYTTNTFKAALAYAVDRTHIDLSYQGSFFYNNLRSLTWENPFDATGPRGTEGGMSLPPDNQFHQLTLSAGRSLFANTRLTGIASVGVMLQDEAFLPDTVDPGLTANSLPRGSLEGEVYLYNAMLALASRPVRGLNLKASYRMQKRDNDTPQDSFTYFVNDSFGGGTSSPDTSTNQPYSYDKRTLRLDAGYRINRKARLSGDIGRETIERTPSEVKKTTEDSGQLKLRLKPFDSVEVSLKAGKASRTGSDYLTLTGENPLLRKYNISDRERVSGGLGISYQPTDRLAVGANLDAHDDDYDETRVGLTDAVQTTMTLDATYLHSDDLSTYAYVGRELFKSRQAGSQDVLPAGPYGPDWFVQNRDTVDSLGMGIQWDANSRLHVSADYVLSRSRGETSMQSNNALPPLSPFPDLKSNLHSLRLKADYKLRKNTSLQFSYRYEKYDADEWPTDGVVADTIPEVLLLGEENPSYDQHAFGLSVAVTF